MLKDHVDSIQGDREALKSNEKNTNKEEIKDNTIVLMYVHKFQNYIFGKYNYYYRFG